MITTSKNKARPNLLFIERISFSDLKRKKKRKNLKTKDKCTTIELVLSNLAVGPGAAYVRQVFGPLNHLPQLLTPDLLPLLLPLLPQYVSHGLTLALLVHLSQLVAALLQLLLLLSTAVILGFGLHCQHSVLIPTLPYELLTVPQVLLPDLLLAALVGSWILRINLHGGYDYPVSPGGGVDDEENR